MIASASAEHLPAQARILIHLQHVDTGVGNSAIDEHRQRFVPRCECLTGQSGDQIDVEVFNSCCPQAGQVFDHDGAVVQPACFARLLVDERLHSQAYAIDARFDHRLQGRSGQLSRGALHRDFGVFLDVESAAKRRKQPLEVVRLKQRWRAAAQVDRIDRAGKVDSLQGRRPARADKSYMSRST